MTTYRQEAEQSALERWNVGYAREWDDTIQTVDDVREALATQAADNGWDVDPEQTAADAEVIADWLTQQRTT